MDIVAGLAKPLIASSGLRSPKTSKETIIKKAILSIGNISKENKTTDTSSTLNTIMISKVMVHLFGVKIFTF